MSNRESKQKQKQKNTTTFTWKHFPHTRQKSSTTHAGREMKSNAVRFYIQREHEEALTRSETKNGKIIGNAPAAHDLLEQIRNNILYWVLVACFVVVFSFKHDTTQTPSLRYRAQQR